MVVQHNMQAANASRMLNITAGQQAKSTEKLSSGYRINRAADDAAGLSISEKMRKQIRGLDRASTNAQDGVSAVQTAEGALTEVHSMLQRMNELAVQSANGTNSSDDRDAIQSEIDQLTKEIDRVSETTKFNETYLLKGGANNNHSTGFKAGASIASFQGVDVTAKNAIATLTSGDQVTLGTVMLKSSDSATIATKDANAKATNLASAEADDTAANGGNVKYTLTDGTTGSMSATKFEAEYGVTIAKAGKVNFSLALGDGTTEIAKDKTTYESGNYTSDFSDAKLTGYKVRDELKLTATVAKDGATTLTKAGVANPLEFNLHVGSESASNNKISVTIESMSAAGLGIDELKVDTESNATSSIDTIEAAIKKVSSQRSNLGAIQNRLEHTIDNLDNVVENTTSAESRIRDTDMADEMVKYSKNNILQQAGQSMLAQANQSTQGVLSLLQ
ncbi:MAG: flagellin [Lachnobacterium sp.]|nr:flagellin [Lachnobacterium sp.]